MNELKRCRKKIEHIIKLTDRRDTLLASLEVRAIRYSHDRIQVSPTDRHTEIMAEVADIDAGLRERYAELRRLRMAALDVIDADHSAAVRVVLTLYYTELYRGENGRIDVWTPERIKQYTGFSSGWIYKILRSDLTGQ